MQPIRKVSEINEGDTVDFTYQGQPAILIKFKDKLHAYVNVCTHEGGPSVLEEAPGLTKPGQKLLHCQWHDSLFDPETGKRLREPAPEGSFLPTIKIEVKGDTIYAI